MPVIIRGHKYYRTAEVCRLAGISRNTLYRLAPRSVFSQAERRDSRGWRLFTAREVEVLKARVNRVDIIHHI